MTFEDPNKNQNQNQDQNMEEQGYKGGETSDVQDQDLQEDFPIDDQSTEDDSELAE